MDIKHVVFARGGGGGFPKELVKKSTILAKKQTKKNNKQKTTTTTTTKPDTNSYCRVINGQSWERCAWLTVPPAD